MVIVDLTSKFQRKRKQKERPVVKICSKVFVIFIVAEISLLAVLRGLNTVTSKQKQLQWDRNRKGVTSSTRQKKISSTSKTISQSPDHLNYFLGAGWIQERGLAPK
jgi:uncharacterized protein YybS (DUF2232 family)